MMRRTWTGVHSALVGGVGTGRNGAMAVPIISHYQAMPLKRKRESVWGEMNDETYLCPGTASISPWLLSGVEIGSPVHGVG